MMERAQETLQKEKIVLYWEERSADFSKLRRAELAGIQAERWLAEIKQHLPQDRLLRVLDIGTGSGFFAALLAGEGHCVTGIDLTPSMIAEAQKLTAGMENQPQFLVMDAERLDFEDESFDLVISRNLTWTLPNVDKAYREWTRVLVPGGILLNFDAEYAKHQEEELPENHVHKKIDQSLLKTCEEIQKGLEISYRQRPAWDIALLQECGFEALSLNFAVSKRIYREKDEFYNPTPLFSVCGIKSR